MRFGSAVVFALANSLTVEGFTRCGSQNPPAELKSTIDLVTRHMTPEARAIVYPPRNVTTHIHVVASNRTSLAKYTRSRVNAQMAVLNARYKGSVTFKLNSTSFTVNPAWAAADAGTQSDYEMKLALRKGTYADLNLYFLDNVLDYFLGVCFFPISNPSAEDIIFDGCTNVADTMPGGNFAPYDLGYTAVHEVGHWFGLFHVFQNGVCHGAGDYVADTPLQANATFGCPTVSDTCPGKPGVDSIHNFMDYSDDACMTEFTPDQMHRALAVYTRLRNRR